MVIVTPLFFMIISLGILFLMKIKNNNSIQETMESFLLVTTIIITFFLSNVVNVISQFFNCTELESDSYISSFLIEKCTNNPNYDFWRNTLIIPALIVYVIGFPLSMFFYMYRNRKNLLSPEVMSKVGFMLNGYYPKKFYWYVFYILIFIYIEFN